MIDGTKVQRAIAEVAKIGSPMRVTGYNRDAALAALRYFGHLIDQRIAELEAMAPARNEREAGQLVGAAEAKMNAPTPSHTNSEGGATDAAPAGANQPAPLPSLPHEDAEGQGVSARDGHRNGAPASSPIHSAAGHELRAEQASGRSPARAVVPVQSEARRLARIEAKAVTVEATIKDQRVNYAGRVVVWGDLTGADLDQLARENAREAMSAAFVTTGARSMLQRWGRHDKTKRVRDRFSDAELLEIENEVRHCGAKLARTVAREARGALPAA